MARIQITLLPWISAPSNGLVLYHSAMEGIIAGRTASDMPGLDIAEQRSWQNFLDSALGFTRR